MHAILRASRSNPLQTPPPSAVVPGGGKVFSQIVYFKVILSLAMEKRK